MINKKVDDEKAKTGQMKMEKRTNVIKNRTNKSECGNVKEDRH